jgi:hypothetical protein
MAELPVDEVQHAQHNSEACSVELGTPETLQNKQAAKLKSAEGVIIVTGNLTRTEHSEEEFPLFESPVKGAR